MFNPVIAFSYLSVHKSHTQHSYYEYSQRLVRHNFQLGIVKVFTLRNRLVDSYRKTNRKKRLYLSICLIDVLTAHLARFLVQTENYKYRSRFF